jgi:hypothetical protein
MGKMEAPLMLGDARKFRSWFLAFQGGMNCYKTNVYFIVLMIRLVHAAESIELGYTP